ncbi:hypothetical protein GQ602_000922 [Ophiocordyceps camponoti-floridani]|uniref:Arrestin-like N-terminal domain-containing protein n=1 Tax=Ophiocordyceps camponoti-floridani TaxID=2030778 RepID=A0A8H4QD27_9HYPO|nr:hypothetical protein GQ602_000922 [Ophiocordyceps camponoti-floridani]
MSLRIALDNRPEFYTNLDHVAGRVILGLNRAEQVGSIVVKLEGESITAHQVPNPFELDANGHPPPAMPGPPGSIVVENHKILYRIQQVFPDDYHSSSSNPYGAFPLQPGEHEFPFRFKLPVNNACSDPVAMARLGGFNSGGGLFGMGGVRLMDGSKQLYLRHVTRTLPPSLTGYPMDGEIRYFIKVTVQRPGFLKENWRYQAGLKFLPIEPPRSAKSGQEAFARRPFTFRPRSIPAYPDRSASSKKGEKGSTRQTPPLPPPNIEISARLPHPPILTCNQPVPLRLIAKKLSECPDQVYLISFQLDLIGLTEFRTHGLNKVKVNRWVVVSNSNLSIPVTSSPGDEVGHELVLPDELWRNRPLPNTVAPSFVTCNVTRRYQMEIKLGLAWGKPGSVKDPLHPQTIFLSLHFSHIEVYSGITPPLELVEAAKSRKPGRITSDRPPLPARPSVTGVTMSSRPSSTASSMASYDPLYPPQLSPGQPVQEPPPPSYDEAMAANLAGPFDGARSRPAYSGVTNENAPSTMPEKR